MIHTMHMGLMVRGPISVLCREIRAFLDHDVDMELEYVRASRLSLLLYRFASRVIAITDV